MLVVGQLGWAWGVYDVGIWDRCGFVSCTVIPDSYGWLRAVRLRLPAKVGKRSLLSWTREETFGARVKGRWPGLGHVCGVRAGN